MAAPTDSARVGTNVATAAATWNINVGSPAAGTLLVVVVRCSGDPGAVTFTGYTALVSGEQSDATDDRTFIYVRLADGTEGATDVWDPTNSVKGSAICWEVTGADDPAIIAPTVSTVAVGTTAANSANPDTATPTGAPVDTLYIATAGGDGEVGAYTAAPTNYANLVTANSGTGGAAASNCFMGGASRQIAASSSDNPGAFTHGAHTTGWTAFTIAITKTPAFINAVPGSYAVTGATDTPVVAGRAIESVPGSYALSGLAAPVVAGRSVEAVPGAYALSGADATIVAGRMLDAALGAYDLVGFVVDLTVSGGGPTDFPLNAEPGSYVLSGLAASIVAGRALEGVPGTYALSGTDAALVASRVISADFGAYAVSGLAAGTLAGRSIEALPGTYALTGTLAALVAGRVLSVDPGAIVVVGVDATLLVPGSYLLDAQPGSYAVAGLAAGIVAGRIIVAVPASYLLAGADAGLLADRILAALGGDYAIAGLSATLLSPAAALPKPERTLAGGESGAALAAGGSGRVLVVGETGATEV